MSNTPKKESKMNNLEITQGKGFGMTFDNGYTLSVQIGPGNYCDNYAGLWASNEGTKTRIMSTTCEMAIIGPDGLIPWPENNGDTVAPYVSVEDIPKWIEYVSNMSNVHLVLKSKEE